MIAGEIINDIVDDFSIYRFPSNSLQFYFMNTEEGIQVNFNSNKKWNSFILPIYLNEDCFFFFESIWQ